MVFTFHNSYFTFRKDSGQISINKYVDVKEEVTPNNYAIQRPLFALLLCNL